MHIQKYSSTPNLFYTQLTGHFLSSNNNLILPSTLISGTQDIEGVNGSLLINCTSSTSSGQLKYRQRKTYKSFQDVSQNHSNNEYQFETNVAGKTILAFIINNVTLFRNGEYQCKHKEVHLFFLNINSQFQSKIANICTITSYVGIYVCI